MSGISIPKPSYLDQCIFIGAGYGKKRWKSLDGSRLFEWDSLHGEIEVYNSRGYHLAVYFPDGQLKGGAVKGRKINV